MPDNLHNEIGFAQAVPSDDQTGSSFFRRLEFDV